MVASQQFRAYIQIALSAALRASLAGHDVRLPLVAQQSADG
jgi:hypothetical protein